MQKSECIVTNGVTDISYILRNFSLHLILPWIVEVVLVFDVVVVVVVLVVVVVVVVAVFSIK